MLGVRFFATLCVLLLFFNSCSKDTAIDPETIQQTCGYTYDDHIKEIIDLNCSVTDCHDAAAQFSGIPMSTYTELKAIAVQPVFLNAINHQPGAEPMPNMLPKLPQATIDSIECWVTEGLQEN